MDIRRLYEYSIRTHEEGFSAAVTDGSWDQFLTSHSGVIVLDGESEEEGLVVGAYTAYSILAAEAVERGLDPVMDVCDSVDDDVLELGRAVYDEYEPKHYHNQFRPAHELEDLLFGNILAIECLELDPRHRGHGLGLAVLDTLARRFGAGKSLVVLKPDPVQFNGEVNETNRAAFDKARGKLQRYCARLGYEPLRGAPEYMALSLTAVRPSLEDALAAVRLASMNLLGVRSPMDTRLKNYVLKSEQIWCDAVVDDTGWDTYVVPHEGNTHLKDDTCLNGPLVGDYGATTILATDAVLRGLDPIRAVGKEGEDVLNALRAVYVSDPGHCTSVFKPEHELEALGGDVLVIDRVSLHSEHRGFGLGLAVLDTMIRRFGQDLVVLSISPWPFEHPMPKDEAIKKLRRYCGHLGFKPLQGAPEYMALEKVATRPTLEEALASLAVS